MGRPRLGTELKKPSDYKYDYPANREVARWLTSDDKVQIAFRTGYALGYVKHWCIGNRRNASIDALARKIARLNQAKQRKLEKIIASIL